jgi:ABC-2 type transport system permease protein
MNIRAFIALVRKDLVLYFSNRRALVMTILAPIAIAGFFGYVFSPQQQKAARVAVAVTDLDHSALSSNVVHGLRSDPNIELRETSEDEAASLVTQGKLRASIVLPRGFGAAAGAALFGGGERPLVTLRHDPSQPMVLAMLRGVLAQHVMTGIGQTTAGRAGGQGGAVSFGVPFATTEIEATGSLQSRYNGFAHSFAGMGVQFILFSGIEFGVTLLMARRLGLWRRLQAAPVSRTLLLGSRIASGAITAFVLLAIIFAAAMAFFGVRIEGSVVGFVGIGIAFSLLTASFGLLIAAIGKTPEATRGLAIFATLILVMLGGAWVPSFVFPEWLQTASLAVPTRWAVDGLDAMTWRGLGIEAAVGPIVAMLAFSAVFAAIAVWRFDWDECAA